ncbi:MAG: protein kinase, partial [Gemmatimonadetes bacterium]|nr:protein kinase [Gemmatimonadota bacterium]
MSSLGAGGIARLREQLARPELPERYALESEIGRGGMGVVWRATDRLLERDVAVKVLAEHLADDGLAERLAREARILARLEHPGVVAVHDAGVSSDGRTWYAMRLVRGRRLDEAAGTEPTLGDTLRLMTRVAETVAYAHEQGIIHRDLKPQNVLLTSITTRGRQSCWFPKVGDFGLSRFVSDPRMTYTGCPLGTPAYMAPEMATGASDAAGPAADIYSVGGILYECLTGRAPFVGQSPSEVLRAVVETEIVPVRRLRPNVPRDLAIICEKCLAKSPDQRYSSAEELVQDLQRFGENLPINARPASFPVRCSRWMRRHPWPIAAAFLMLLSTCGIVGGLIWHQYSLRQERDAALAKYQATRQAVRQMLPVLDDRVFAIPEYTELIRRQQNVALKIVETLNDAEQTAESRVDLARLLLDHGSLLASIGEFSDAESSLRRAVQLVEAVDSGSMTPEVAGVVVAGNVKTAVSLSMQGRNEAAKLILQNVVAIARDASTSKPDSYAALDRAAWTLHNLGNAHLALKEYDQATACYSESIEIRQASLQLPSVSQVEHKNSLGRMAETRVNLAVCLMVQQQDERAAGIYELAISDFKTLLESQPDDVELLKSLATTYLNLSNITVADDPRKAIEQCQQGIEIGTRFVHAMPGDVVVRNDLSMLYGNHALFLRELGDWEPSLKSAQHAIQLTSNAR